MASFDPMSSGPDDEFDIFSFLKKGKIGSGTFDAFGGAAQDILGGMATKKSFDLKAEGSRAEARGYRGAAELAGQNRMFTQQSTAVKQAGADRAIYQATGKQSAEVAGFGMDGTSGTALDIMRSSVQQGALTKQLVGQQGLITEAGYAEQQKAYINMANYSEYAANEMGSMGKFAEMSGFITGGLKGLAGLAMFL